jgi:class 3 adenylate cyclase
MPLFMDRHEMPGAGQAEVAQVHLSDLATGPKYGVQFLAYWFDADRDETFCLANAPVSEALEAVHRESHGLVPYEIISVSEDIVLRFLGRINDPVDHSRVASPFRTILFTDLEGSTSLLQTAGEAAFMALLTEHDLIIRQALVASRGREVKHTGDGVMASFGSARGALACAVDIQRGLADTDGIRVRIGLNAGEPVAEEQDLFGSSVQLAARVCAKAEAGQILVSNVVRELAMDPMRLYEVAWNDAP